MSTQEFLCTGGNFFGQLGRGYSTRSNPAHVPSPFASNEMGRLEVREVQDVQCGTQFTVVVKKNGEIHFCGTMNGSVFPSLTLVDVPHPLRCVQIACGRKHILALMEGGYVLSWGTGYLGQLGLGDDSSWDSPRMIRHLEPKRIGDTVKTVVCGGSHSGVITTNGNIYMWGLNRNGQTGTGVKVESILEPRPIDLTDIGRKVPKSLVCGRNHTMLLTTEGRVYSWGAGGAGRLGSTEPRKNQYTPFEIQFFRSRPALLLQAGDFHNVAMCQDGQIYTWGFNLEGQCGNGSTINQKLPKKVDILTEYLSNSLANLIRNDPIEQIVCGSSWSSVISTAGHVYSWGYGDGGWLGLESNELIQNGFNVTYFESELPCPVTNPPDSMERYELTSYSRSFDSNLNLLRPIVIPFVDMNQYRVKWMRCGGGHTIYCVEKDVTKQQLIPLINSLTQRGEAKGTDDTDSEGEEVKETKSEAKELIRKQSAKQLLSETKEEKLIEQIEITGQFGFQPSSLSSSSSPNVPVTLDIFMSWIRHKKIPEIFSAIHSETINLNDCDGNGNSPLHIACQNGHYNICKILIDNGGKETLDKQNKKGNTPLHYCMAYGFKEISDYLILCGANEFLMNSEGLTCYEGLSRDALERI